MMKASACAAMIVALCSCADDQNISDLYTPSLEAHYIACYESSNINLASDEAHYSFYLEATNTPWQFSGMADWLTVEPKSGNYDAQVAFSAGKNPSGEDIRTTVFNLESTWPSYPYKKEFSVSQYPSSPYVMVDISDLSISGGEYEQSYAVDANVEWYAYIYTGSSWLTATASDDGKQLIIHAKANPESSSRTGYIYIKRYSSSGTLQKIKVTQTAASVKIDNDQSSLNHTNAGGSYQLNITADAEWTATTDADWIEVNPNVGKSGNTTVTVSTTPNNAVSQLSGYVYFKLSTATKSSVKVTQEGISLTLSKSILSFDCSESSQTVTVTANTDWKILSQPDWLVITPNSGNGNGLLTVKALANYSPDKREGTITVGKEGTTLKKTISVSQKAWVFENLISNLSFDADAGKQAVELQAEGNWTAVASHDWITVSPTAGTGNGQIEVAVKENTTENQRSGVVEVTTSYGKLSIAVAQKGKYFTVDGGQLAKTITSRGGTHRIQFQTNDSWTATNTSTWATLSKTSGKGDVDVTLTVADNPSINSREDTTIITPAHMQPVRVITKQDARYLKVNVTKISFFKKGGTTEPYMIDTDADYTVKTDDSWFTISHDANAHTFTLTATENTSVERRTGKVVVAMTGLNQGESYQLEIPVIQLGAAEDINIIDFGGDQNWNLGGDSHFNIKVTGYGSDENWNYGDNATFGVKVTGFGADEDWNY